MALLDHKTIIDKALRLSQSTTPSVAAHTGVTTSKGKYKAHQDIQTRLLQMLPLWGAGVLSQPNFYAGTEHREDQLKFVLDMYEGKMVAYLDKFEAESPEQFENRMGKFTLPLTSAAIDTLARLYDGAPTRTTLNDDYLSWASTQNLNEYFQQAERYETAMGGIGIRVLHSAERGIFPELLTSDRIRTVPNPDDVHSPHAVVVRWTEEDLNGGSLVEWATIYTREEIILVKDGEPQPVFLSDTEETTLKPGPSGMGVANPYRVIRSLSNGTKVDMGVIPIALSRFRLTGSDWHCDGLGQSLADRNAELNNLFSSIFHQAYMQAFTPVVAINRASDRPLVWGPGTITDLRMNKGEQADLKTVSLQSHIPELMNMMTEAINQTLKSMRIPESALHATADASGVSIVAASAPLSEFRKASIARYKRLEKSVYVTWLAVNAYHSGLPTPIVDDLDLLVDYPEPQVAQSVESKINEQRYRLEMSLDDLIDIELGENGDAYTHLATDDQRRAEAEETLSKRREVNIRLGAVRPAPEFTMTPPDTDLEF